MAEQLGIGVVGAGGIARSHLEAIARVPEARLVGVMDVDAARVRQVAEEYGARAFSDFEALLADPAIEAVHLCTPHSLHAPQAIAALAAGKHVLVEKPMALTLADCDRMIAASERAGRLLMVGQVMRYWPIHRQIREMIRSGAIGRPGHLIRRRLSHFHPGTGGSSFRAWYADPAIGGICVLYCFGPHEYDILPWLIDSPVVRVYAQGTESTPFYRGQNDSYSAIMTHASGAVSVLAQSVSCHTGAHDTTIVGSEGSLHFDHRRLWWNGNPVETAGAADGMLHQIAEFVRCCREGGEPDASARSVRHTMAAIEAAKLSAERNAPVDLEELG